MLPDLHIGFSRGRSGGLVFPSLEEFSTVYLLILPIYYTSLSWWLIGKEFTCQAGDPGLIPGLKGSSGEGNGNPFQYSCLGNPKDRGAIAHEVANQPYRTWRLNSNPSTFTGQGVRQTMDRPSHGQIRFPVSPGAPCQGRGERELVSGWSDPVLDM